MFSLFTEARPNNKFNTIKTQNQKTFFSNKDFFFLIGMSKKENSSSGQLLKLPFCPKLTKKANTPCL